MIFFLLLTKLQSSPNSSFSMNVLFRPEPSGIPCYILHPVFMPSWCSPEGGSCLLLVYYALESFEEYWLVGCFVESLNLGFVWFFFSWLDWNYWLFFTFWKNPIDVKRPCRPVTPGCGSHMVAPLTLTFAVGCMASARCSLMLLLAGAHPCGQRQYPHILFRIIQWGRFYLFLSTYWYLLIMWIHVYSASILGFNRMWCYCYCYCANGSILCHQEVPRVGSWVPLTHVLHPSVSGALMSVLIPKMLRVSLSFSPH